MKHLLLTLILLLAITPAFAQDDAPTCQPTAIKTEMLGAVSALDDTDPTTMAASLSELIQAAALAQIACTGLTFTSDDYGVNAVVGPVEIPAGLYTATFTTGSGGAGASVDLTVVEGSCGPEFSENVFFSDAAANDETLFPSDGCTALFETTDFGSGTWQLSFTRLN